MERYRLAWAMACIVLAVGCWGNVAAAQEPARPRGGRDNPVYDIGDEEEWEPGTDEVEVARMHRAALELFWQQAN